MSSKQRAKKKKGRRPRKRKPQKKARKPRLRKKARARVQRSRPRRKTRAAVSFTPMLETLLGSPVRARLLRFFYRHSDDSFSTATIAKMLLVNVPAVVRECEALSKIGVLKARPGGGYKRYQASSAFPFSGELRAMALHATALSPAAIVAEVSRAVKPRLIAVSGAFLTLPSSSIDMLVVADRILEGALSRVMRRLEAQLGCELRWTAFSTNEFAYRWKMYDRFVRSVLEGPHEILLGKLPK